MYSHVLKRQSIAKADNAGGQEDFYAYELKNQCSTCGHLNRTEPTTCAAFPHGIPVGILMGKIDHTLPFMYGSLTDHGLQYVPMDGPAPEETELFL
jgi:hypothetical protein